MIKRKKRGKMTPHQSSIVLDLHSVFALRNIKTPVRFLLNIGINPNTANKMLKGEAVQLSFTQMTSLCVHLNCTPNDLLALRDMQLPQNHALLALRKLEAPEKTVDWDELMKGKSLDEIRKLLGG